MAKNRSDDWLTNSGDVRRNVAMANFVFIARQVGSEATAGRPVAPDKLRAPQPQTKPGPPNSRIKGSQYGERAMIEGPILFLIGLMVIGLIVSWRYRSVRR